MKKAEEMPFKFLFYSDEYADDFFNNLSKNIIVENDNYVFFINRNVDENTMFWAGKTMEEVIYGLNTLNSYLDKGTTIIIRCGEDKSNLGQMEQTLPFFVNNGGIVTNHNIGYSTHNLNFSCPFPLVHDASLEDKEESLILCNSIFGTEKFSMDLEELEKYITDENNCLFIVRDNDKIAGLILGAVYNKGKSVFIRGLAVDSAYRGLGYSNQLLSKVFHWSKEKGVEGSMLWVENSNKVARALYEKFGYTPYGDQEAILKYVV